MVCLTSLIEYRCKAGGVGLKSFSANGTHTITHACTIRTHPVALSAYIL